MVSPRFNYAGHRNSYTELNEVYSFRGRCPHRPFFVPTDHLLSVFS
jgi:hypothetical protein